MDNTPGHFMGMDGFNWFFGIVESRMDPLKCGRHQVRVHAWNSASKAMVPTENLPWAHSILPLNVKAATPVPEGTMVFGFFQDGAAGQYPVIMGHLPGIPDTPTDPSQGFSDPRTNAELQAAPRPPQNVNYNTSGSGVTVTEAPNATRNPQNLNEPTTSRLARHENIQDTIIQQKINSTLTNVPVATGSLTLPPGLIDLHAVISLPSLTIPSFSFGFNPSLSFEICGLGINAAASLGFSFGGLSITPPTISLDGQIFFSGININAYLAAPLSLGVFGALAIDIAGCLLGGIKIGNKLIIDGGLVLPLLPLNASFDFSGIGIKGTISGGISLGTVGGIPLAVAPTWSEPKTPYNAQYPYNHALIDSEAGHAFEIDDTPGSERIHLFHRTGTFLEIGPTGQEVHKVVNNQFNIAMADHNTNVMGNQHVTVNQDKTDLIQGNHQETINGNRTQMIQGNKTHTVMGTEQATILKDQNVTISQNRFSDIKGDDNQIIEGNQNVTILKNCNVVILADCQIAAAGSLTLSATEDLTIIAGGQLTLQSGQPILANPDIIAGTQNISSVNHVHGDVMSGGGDTSPPIKNT